jgi:hypothetical protein
MTRPAMGPRVPVATNFPTFMVVARSLDCRTISEILTVRVFELSSILPWLAVVKTVRSESKTASTSDFVRNCAHRSEPK